METGLDGERTQRRKKGQKGGDGTQWQQDTVVGRMHVVEGVDMSIKEKPDKSGVRRDGPKKAVELPRKSGQNDRRRPEMSSDVKGAR